MQPASPIRKSTPGERVVADASVLFIAISDDDPRVDLTGTEHLHGLHLQRAASASGCYMVREHVASASMV